MLRGKHSHSKSTGRHNTLSNSGRNGITKSTPSNGKETRNRTALRSNSASSAAHGTGIAHNIGTPTTAVGNNVAATTATASLTIGSADTLARTTGSALAACPLWS